MLCYSWIKKGPPDILGGPFLLFGIGSETYCVSAINRHYDAGNVFGRIRR